MTSTILRNAALVTATALAASGLSVASAPNVAAAPAECVAGNPTETITVFGFNDFHGRVIDDLAAPDNPARYLAGRLFTPVEQARAAQGDDHVALISSGDNIGASTFVSMIADDEPTLDVLNAAGLESSTVGNHEFDKGWSDLSGRVVPQASGFSYLGANVYVDGTTTVAAPLEEYTIVSKAGVRIAIVGAVTGEVPSLVSPGGIRDLTFGDPVEAVNRVTDQLLDGDESNGEADIVLASFHEGAGSSALSPDENATDSSSFNSIYRGVDRRVAAIFNAHTHQEYAWEDAYGRPLLQAGDYARLLAQLDLVVDATTKGLCSASGKLTKAADTSDESLPRIAEINRLAGAAYTTALELGSVEIGSATQAISTPDGGTGVRTEESPMTNMVAQMFHDTLGAGDPEFIGIQNPGGTRDSFNAGPITYREAAMTLPFANSLFTTEITGAQFTKVLEQQWQRTLDGAVPSRPFLQLGLSSNVSYTYDESLPEGSRITSVSINGKPIDPEKTYRVGSGSFLISGGDNFHELAQGTDTRDTGITDLSAWVGWVQDNSPLSPDYSKRGVSAKLPTGPLTVGGDALSFTFGQALDGGLATQSLDMLLTEGDKVSPPLANTEITAYLGDRQIGAGTVTEGVGTVSVQLPSDALLSAAARAATSRQILRFTVQGSGTDIFVPFDIETPVPPSPEPDPSASPTPKPTPTKGTPTSSAKPGPSKRPGLPSSGANR